MTIDSVPFKPFDSGAPRKKVLFFAECVTLAHLARPAVLSGMLAETEFDCVVARHPRYMSLFPDMQSKQVDLDSISTEQFLDALARGRPLYSASVLERYVEEDLRIIDEEKPDIIVGDFRISLSISARLRKIPYLSVSNVYWSPTAKQSYTIPEHPMSKLLNTTSAELLFKLVRPIVFGAHSIPMNTVRKNFGLKSLGMNLRKVYTDSDYLLFADLPHLVDMAYLPPHYRFMGPILWSPEHKYPEWWQEIDASSPNIYVTLGSSGRSDLLPIVLEAVRGLPVKIMASTAGHSMDIGTQESQYVAEYLPGEAAAAKSDLVICNGGSLTTYQAFSQGVPVLGIAGNLDQHLNMLAIERLGAGIRLRSEKSTIESIRRSVTLLLQEPSYRRKAEGLRAEMSKIDTKSRFVDLLREI